jgi:hypothetical protein
MPKGEQSKFKLYSLGIVLETKEDGDDYINVHPIEELPQVDGKIADITVDYDVTLPDAQDGQKSTKLTGTMGVRAKWIPWGDGNRMTPPDVVKNETVLLFKFGDDDQFYWTCHLREPTIRRKERVCYMFCDLESGLESYNKESAYWYEFSTKDGHIWFSTSQAAGEAFKYDFIIDTANSTVGLYDDVNNGFFIDSHGETAMVRNQNGCMVSCEKNDVKTFAVETSIETAKDIVQQASVSIKREAQTISDKATSITQEATSITQKASSISQEAASFSSKAGGGGGAMEYQAGRFAVNSKDWMKRLDYIERRLQAIDGLPPYSE